MQVSVEDSFQSWMLKATVVEVELYFEVIFCLFVIFVCLYLYCIVQFEYLVSLKEQLDHLGIS